MSKNNSASILGTGSSVPANTLTNHDLEKMVDTSDEWIRKRTGIRERRIATNGTATSDLAEEAAREALEEANVAPEDLGAIVVGTITPDNIFPSAACHLQRKLGATGAGAFDVSAACSGFIYAFTSGWSLVSSGFSDRVLVVGAEVLSTITDYQDRSMCILFGDGAGATVLGPGNGRRRVEYTNMYARGDEEELMVVPGGGSRMPASVESVRNRKHYMRMEGRKVFKFAVPTMAEMIEEAAEAGGIDVADIRLVVPHQVNQRILDSVCDRLDYPEDRMYSNLQRYGNTSGASIPLALDEALDENDLEEGDYVVLTAVGAGLTWGTILLRW